MAHILVFTPSVRETIRFYRQIPGLRVSDQSGDGICFMHGIRCFAHHLIALAKSHGPGLHHVS
ncbi:VOC family protein [Thalassospira sp. NFXS8]